MRTTTAAVFHNLPLTASWSFREKQFLPHARQLRMAGGQLCWQQWWLVICVQVDATRVVAFDKEGIDMTVFKPNHFATLCVYYSLFLRRSNMSPRNGLARWCSGIRAYIPGDTIEPEEIRRENLASHACLPIMTPAAIHNMLDSTNLAKPSLLLLSRVSCATSDLQALTRCGSIVRRNIAAWQNTENALTSKLRRWVPVLCFHGSNGAWCKVSISFVCIRYRLPVTTGR